MTAIYPALDLLRGRGVKLDKVERAASDGPAIHLGVHRAPILSPDAKSIGKKWSAS